MSCLGVHFALDGADEAKLLSLKSDEERLTFVTEIVEERYFKTPFACESDKAWDAIHRCFDDGKLSYDASTPLRMTILGGTPLYELEDYIIAYKTADDVRDIDRALSAITSQSMRPLHDAIDPADYGFAVDNEHWEYTWHWFEEVREFYKRAAADGRSVIFTSDQ